MTLLKKITLGLTVGILGIYALLKGAYHLPFPIEGNWTMLYRLTPCMSEGCDGKCHEFLRFEDGKILCMSDRHSPPWWLGTYQRKGWGTYGIELFSGGGTDSPLVFHSTGLRLTSSHDEAFQYFRDYHLWACRKAVNHPSNDWMCVHRADVSLRVAGAPEERVFILGSDTRKTKGQIESLLRLMIKDPFHVYTASNEVSSAVVETLVTNGFDYVVHTSQEWTVSDTLRTNPVWNALGKSEMFGLIITVPPKKESRETEDKIYFVYKEHFDFDGFEKRIRDYRRMREQWRKDLHLYVENGVLPEDVRQMFDPFDFEYTVEDEKVLYRGKRGKGGR